MRHITFNHISNKTLTSKTNSIREAVPRNEKRLLTFGKEGEGGSTPIQKFWCSFFGLSFGHFPKEGGGLLIPKVLG